ncbi:MAG: hypothetical protein WB630_22070 [Candidatus Acidiferrales bacterium]
MSLPTGVIHADDFIMDVIDLNEKRAVAAFRELRPPWEAGELIQRFNGWAMGDLCKHPCG